MVEMTRRVAIWVVFVIATTFTMINLHEIGHTLVALLAGDKSASYHLYQTYPHGGHCLGCNVYNPNVMSVAGQIWTSLGGVIFTQLCMALALIGLAVSGYRRHKWFWIVGICIFLLGDGLYQSVQGLAANSTAQSGLSNVDLADVLYLLHVHDNYSIFVMKIILGLITIMYLVIVLWLLKRHFSLKAKASA